MHARAHAHKLPYLPRPHNMLVQEGRAGRIRRIGHQQAVVLILRAALPGPPLHLLLAEWLDGCPPLRLARRSLEQLPCRTALTAT